MSRIAVIGAGISGLAAAYFLSRRHEVSLFEREERLGGHTRTVRVQRDGGAVALDTGFLVHNTRTYPNLVRLFAELEVETRDSDMSFSVTCPQTGFEYSSRGCLGFFAQARNVINLDHVRLLRDIMRFNREAPGVLSAPAASQSTLASYVRDHGYGDSFVARYLVPMTSAIWSAPIETIQAFPIRTLLQFMQNHGMLSVGTQVIWRVVRGGSDSYVGGLIRPLGERIQCHARLSGVVRGRSDVALLFEDQPPQRFDAVVLACHGDQVLPLLANPTAAEREVFGAFRTTANDTVLHTDERMLPEAPRARASWNYLLGGRPEQPPSVTYDLNRLQGISGPTQYCVTLNPTRPLAAGSVIGAYRYRHPQISHESVAAQARWREVSAGHRTHYCGAYWRYGFHEDGLWSAMRVADDLGAAW